MFIVEIQLLESCFDELKHYGRITQEKKIRKSHKTGTKTGSYSYLTRPRVIKNEKGTLGSHAIVALVES
ncbi:hypothetical protein A0J61_09465 [Choanephora cucurbitarum]|uniref:Uncharacterized protein n=1 Tax=Choanephora cucurbitarum TaxID=101091 RepID=A0A1C7N003_9FUNG|nr:hypothetical protein A0J61_09465 [Choanephora cucurbitarum]